MATKDGGYQSGRDQAIREVYTNLVRWALYGDPDEPLIDAAECDKRSHAAAPVLRWLTDTYPIINETIMKPENQ